MEKEGQKGVRGVKKEEGLSYYEKLKMNNKYSFFLIFRNFRIRV